MLKNILNLLFAPIFVLLIHYFELKVVVLGYLILAIIYFIYSFIKKQTKKDMIIPTIYVVILSLGYYFSSLQSIKYIPLILSTIFLMMFIDSHFNQKYMILNFTKQFYSKDLSAKEIEFLKHGDLYWVVVMGINTIIHFYVVNYTSDAIWAFYSSIGWYILFFISLIAQIIYGKVYAIKMYYR
jgi:intracellular septation protein A